MSSVNPPSSNSTTSNEYHYFVKRADVVSEKADIYPKQWYQVCDNKKNMVKGEILNTYSLGRLLQYEDSDGVVQREPAKDYVEVDKFMMQAIEKAKKINDATSTSQKEKAKAIATIYSQLWYHIIANECYAEDNAADLHVTRVDEKKLAKLKKT